jgi:signal transduction histidine kinase
VDEPRAPNAPWIPIIGVIVAVAGLATIGVHATYSPDGRAGVDGLLVATCLGGAAVGFTRYRSTGDSSPLFVAAGLAVVAVQTVVFDQHWIRSEAAFPWEGTSLPGFGWFAAWMIAGVGFVLARPWWDRRGRKPIRAPLVFGVAAAALAVIDPILIGLRHSLPPVKNVEIRHGGVLEHTAPGLIALGLIAIVLLAIAAWREFAVRGDARSTHPWLTLAWTVAVAAQVVLLAHPVPFRPFVVPADALTLIAVAAALIASLAPLRAEASRARRASDRAQEVMGGRAEIAAMIAHEVRGPVSTVRGLAGTALVHYDRLSDDERREFLDLIEQESRRLLVTVTQASNALKVDAETIAYILTPQELAPAVHEGVEAADTRDHLVEIDIPDGIKVRIDRRWLPEAVRQVVDNAARFSPPSASISVTARADGDWVSIEVTDHGPGIPPERRGEVFEKYVSWRPDGYEQKAGSGLGLFLTRGIVSGHNGQVSIEDVPGGGTMLRIRLPLSDAREA